MSTTSLVEISAAEQKLAARVDPSVTGQLEVSGTAGGLGFRNASEAMEFAKLMALSHVAVPKHLRGNPGACLAVTIQAVEWQMSPYAVANKSYSVNDRLAYESQLIQAVILKRAPIKGRFRFSFSGAGVTRKCKVEVTTNDGEVVDYETPEFKDIPVKNSPLWKGDPDQQLTYYAGRAMCRRHFPDVLLGVLDRDEVDEAPRDPGRARDVTPAPRSLAARMDALATPSPATTAPAEDGAAAQEDADAPADAELTDEVLAAAAEHHESAAGAENSPAADTSSEAEASPAAGDYVEPDWIALATANEYIDAAERHILAAADPVTLDAWWRNGRQLRTRLGVPVEDATTLAQKVAMRCKALRGAK